MDFLFLGPIFDTKRQNEAVAIRNRKTFMLFIRYVATAVFLTFDMC